MTEQTYKYWEFPVCKFYRFSDFNKDIFTKLRIHLSSPVLFNDPFEGVNDDMPFLQHDSLVTCFTGLNREGGDSSNTLFNPLMWSHYSDSHRGFCIIYDPLLAGLFPVKYVKIRPDKYDYQKTLTSKGSVWAYENEYRFIGSKSPSELGRIEYENGEYYLKIYPDDIKGVIFGCKASESDISRIMNYLFSFAMKNDVGDRGVRSLTIKTLKLKKNEFELEAGESFIFKPTQDPNGLKPDKWTIIPDFDACKDEVGSIADILRNAPLNKPASRPETPARMEY